ncbi:hypothetical protein Q4574_07705 [Aliiglaciecola sp. 3_MG-2023]|uniref:hypothetical protein n=1 Tax=Aliiglaciecola sp. 3_MG-2023 TaxID=3062644 RepID=UPI0026E34B85|nr:hypothetical protein [Aliiglaciecola sp. 3_MG-2023]MDO6693166.1 hypothetical protein [Aliiglaciecola sp. 3_MG-2023]
MKNLQFENSSTVLACHPTALPAFEFTQLVFHFHNERKISEARLRLLNRMFRLTTFSKENKDLFFEGWMPLICGLTPSVKKQLRGGISNIEQRAWLYSLHSILHLSPKKDVIYNISLFFEYAPDRIQARLFTGKLPATVLARTISFTSESRAAVKHAMNKEAKK